jgi:hypothetical protein
MFGYFELTLLKRNREKRKAGMNRWGHDQIE